jgi:hypothetical protein
LNAGQTRAAKDQIGDWRMTVFRTRLSSLLLEQKRQLANGCLQFNALGDRLRPRPILTVRLWTQTTLRQTNLQAKGKDALSSEGPGLPRLRINPVPVRQVGVNAAAAESCIPIKRGGC